MKKTIVLDNGKNIEVEFVKGAVKTVFRRDENAWFTELIMQEPDGIYWTYTIARSPNREIADKITALFAEMDIEELFDMVNKKSTADYADYADKGGDKR
ncbi:MAG: hypothetical protein V1701_02610 [Planctomycetota bacterium]